MLLCFIADDRYFATLKPQLTILRCDEEAYDMESTQTWVTNIVKNHSLVRRQPSAYHAKPGSECYVIDRFIGTIAEWSEYCTLLDAVGWQLAVRNSTRNLH